MGVYSYLKNSDTFKLIERKGHQPVIEAYGKLWPLTSELNIELAAYRANLNGEGWKHMRNADFLIWPAHRDTWHAWTEQRFKTHVDMCVGTDHNCATWAGGAATGKGSTLNTKIKTPYGWVRMKDIQEGDVISDPHGGVQVVTKVHPIQERLFYRVRFNDNTFVDCWDDHLWVIQTHSNRATGKQQLVNTKSLYDLVKHYGKNKISIPRTKAVWQPEQDLPLDPYILGLFIGDGYISKDEDRMNVGIAKSSVKDFLLTQGCTATWRDVDNTWRIPLKQYKQVLTELGYLDVKSSRKFIPTQYMKGSIKQRAALLAGLLDTDGYLAVECVYEYTTKSTRLAIQIVNLARSLGYKATLRKKKSVRYEKSYGTINRIHISDLSNGEPLPTLRLKPRLPKTRAHQLITSIEPIGNKKGRCITVSNNDGLYLTNGYIVTHNSFDAARIAILFWLANPTGRTVLVASTSLGDLESRIWGYIKKFYLIENTLELPGKMYSANAPKILMRKEDSVHGMFALPLQKGTSQRTASTLIGRHPDEGFLAVIDEGTDVTPGFIDAIPNWQQGVETFQLIVIGNSSSRFDPHGLMSKPLSGWHTIDPDYDTEWDTKNGKCLYFDCYQSPAILDKDEEKRKKLGKFLFTEESIEKNKLKYGDNTPGFWRFVRGFWPKDDLVKTILTPVMCDKFHVEETAGELSPDGRPSLEWEGTMPLIRLAGLDPAFHSDGDDCVFRWATLGMATSGKMVLDFGGKQNVHYIRIDDSSKEPAEYQILSQTKVLCEKLGIPPKNLAVDVWGSGSGLGAILAKEWSKDIYQVASSGHPTETLVSLQTDDRACDVYDRRITELWFSVRQLVQTEQIKGLDPIAMEQFCTRLYEFKSGKYKIEPKPDYKIRLGKVDNHYKSPDEADSVCLIVDLARLYFNFISTNVGSPITRESILMHKFNEQRKAEEMYYKQMNGEDVYTKDTSIDIYSDGFLNDYDFTQEDH